MSSSDSAIQERLQTAASDLASLVRVSHRLALVDTSARLQQVLEKLLPRLLKRIGDNHLEASNSESALKSALDKIHVKLVETLSHTMKRVREDNACKLPCLDILKLLLNESEPGKDQASLPVAKTAVDPFTLNLSLTFLTIGLPRSDRLELDSLWPGLLVLVGHTATLEALGNATRRSQANQLAHLLLQCVEGSVHQISSSGKDKPSTGPTIFSENLKSSLPLSRQACRDPTIAPVFYDLLLDVILYQPTAGNVPPNGLSQAGSERLQEGNSPSARDWAAEMASRTRLVQLKLSVLDIISPSRHWALFLGTPSQENSNSLGVARTVALLVAASGDPMPDVASRAASYLKAYRDSFRGHISTTTQLYGNPIALFVELLSLCLGQAQAEASLTGIAGWKSTPLGKTEPMTATGNVQLVLSTRRRSLIDSPMASLVSFVSSSLLELDPELLNDVNVTHVRAFATLAIQVSLRSLRKVGSPTGLSTQRAKQFVATAELLNTLAVRLVVCFDSNLHGSDDLASLMAQSLVVACSALSSIASLQRPLSDSLGSEGSIAIRDACYGVICSLSRSQFALLKEGYIFNQGSPREELMTPITQSVSIETVTLLFGCASKESEKLRARAVAALDALLGAYCRVYTDKDVEQRKQDTEHQRVTENPWIDAATKKKKHEYTPPVHNIELSRSLLPLLWTSAQSFQPKASRVAAARWSSELLRKTQLSTACHLLCFLAGDGDVTAASIAKKGLGLSKASSGISTTEVGENSLPEFGEFAQLVFHKGPSSTLGQLHRYWSFSFQGKEAALRFGLRCMLNDLYDAENDAISLFLSTLTETLEMFAHEATRSSSAGSSLSLLDEVSSCFLTVLQTSQFARRSILNASSFGLAELEALVFKSSSSKARRQLAGALGALYEDTSVSRDINAQHNENGNQIIMLSLGRSLALCSENLYSLNSNVSTTSQIHGASFLGGHCVRALRLKNETDVKTGKHWEAAAMIASHLAKGTTCSDDTVGNACADSLAIAMSYDTSDAPPLHVRLHQDSAMVLNSIADAVTKYGHGDLMDAPRVAKLVVAAGQCLAATTIIAESLEQLELAVPRYRCFQAILLLLGSTSYRKDEEIALVAGEALALYSDAYSPVNATYGKLDANNWPHDYSEDYARQLPPHSQTLYVLLRKYRYLSSPHERTSSAQALLALVGRCAGRVQADRKYASRFLPQSLLLRLDEIQQAFIGLLADPKSKHLSRESCCLGLAACRGLAGSSTSQATTSEKLNLRLLHAFGQSTNFGGSALMETSVQATQRREPDQEGNSSARELMERFGIEDETGGTSGMGEAALGAYREMASASVSLGRPEILYALLVLSVSHSVWFSKEALEKYSAAALLGNDTFGGSRMHSTEIRSALRPHLGKLLPRLLRACHDPNKQTREQMSFLWNGLTGGGTESRQIISIYFDSTLDTLLEAATNKLWRARAGACGALTEIIAGRDWYSLGGGPPILNDDDLFGTGHISAGVRLLRLWRVAMRSLDDVRGAVRERGEALGRGLRALTIRLCDNSLSDTKSGAKRSRENLAVHERDASAAAATSIRWLVRHGLNQSCPEASGLSVSTLVEVVQMVRPRILEPILPLLLRSLLLAMSGLEPAALNFLQLRTQDQAGLERLRLQLAQTGPLASAVSKCVDLLPSVSIKTQREVITELDSTLRLSAGFASRAATADAVSMLCNTCPDAFRFAGVPSGLHPTVRLLRAFYFAAERERGQGSKDKMIHSLGSLAALCPGGSVRSLAARACDNYNRSTGNNDDPAARKAAASALRAIAVRASSQFSDGGTSDIWRRRVLPVAFVGKQDSDSSVRTMWTEVWKEGECAVSFGKAVCGTSLEEQILTEIVRECNSALGDVSWSRRVAGSKTLIGLSKAGVLGPTSKSSNQGDSYLRAKRRAMASASALTVCIKVLQKRRLWTGKATVLSAAISICTCWIKPQFDAGIDQSLLLGFEGNSEMCPWKPITHVARDGDLLKEDSYFLSENANTEEDTPCCSNNTENFTEGTSSVFDFMECDKNAESEEVTPSTLNENQIRTASLTGILRFLAREGMVTDYSQNDTDSDECLPYKLAAMGGFVDLLQEIPPSMASYRMELYELISDCLLSPFDGSFRKDPKTSKQPPVLLAAALKGWCGLFWEGVGAIKGTPETADAVFVAKLLRQAGGKQQSAWTLREIAPLSAGRYVGLCGLDALRNYQFVSTLADIVRFALEDKKFWRVRFAGLQLLTKLVGRVNTGPKELVLDALLPFKEIFLLLAKSMLRDSEAQITALSSELVSSMAWWP